MKVIFLNQYYPPDIAPTGVMLESVARSLVSAGYEVTVVCGRSNYGKRKSNRVNHLIDEGVNVVHVWSLSLGKKNKIAKMLEYVSYYVGVFVYVLLHPVTLVVALTTPPYLSVLARLGTKIYGGRHAHWVMDLYPDVMFAHGMIREHSLAGRCLKGAARFGFGGSRSSAVLGLGPDMVTKIRPYLTRAEKVNLGWVPLWSTVKVTSTPITRTDPRVTAWRKNRGWSEEDVILLYSGNMGLGHRFDEFFELANHIMDQTSQDCPPIKLCFTGGGARKSQVEAFIKEHPDAPIEIGGYVDREHLEVHLASADVHLASLEPSWDGTMVPSKIQGIFGCARPLLFVGSPSCTVAHWVQEAGAGWVMSPYNGNDMSEMISILTNAVFRERCGNAAFEYFKRHFQAQSNAEKVASFLVAESPALE